MKHEVVKASTWDHFRIKCRTNFLNQFFSFSHTNSDRSRNKSIFFSYAWKKAEKKSHFLSIFQYLQSVQYSGNGDYER